MRERFAPSPTGFLHLGHAFSALTAWDAAQASGGEFLLRIEDIDAARARPEFETAIFDDLHWLGLSWPTPPMRQSARMAAYHAALEHLTAAGLVYPCRCSRRDIAEALAAPQEGVTGDAALYPGTCRGRNMADRGANDAVRLDMAAAIEYLGGDMGVRQLGWLEIGEAAPQNNIMNARELVEIHGDIVLARRDIGASYHLAVVVDDAAQHISHVTRGQDMQSTTPVHRILQAVLNLPTPIYRHHRLIRDGAGKRLAKRDDARAIRRYRADGVTPADIRRLVGL